METLIKQCLYNWLGYGNLNSRIWFIGTEEGGAEIWRLETKSLEESLEIRSHFNLSMDFIDVWESQYNISLNKFQGPNVWRYISAFMLAVNKAKANQLPETTIQEISDYLFKDKKLGRIISDHFLCELYPLPKRSKNSIVPYQEIWKNVGDYSNEVIKGRLELIYKAINDNKNISLIVLYEKSLKPVLIEYYSAELRESWQVNKESYNLYCATLNETRNIYMLTTPFFGQGQISYKGIQIAIIKLKELNIL